MAMPGESGWQSEKTLAECMRYMLDNEVSTDVCFEVGPPDGATVDFRAHKYMLISRSPVFDVMFSSGFKESRSGPHEKIRVQDIDPVNFKQLLNYIYFEEAPINVETAASLMYAAKKYMMNKLVSECGKCLSEGLSSNNVIHVLEQSILFDDAELKSKCLELIAQHGETVLTGSEINSASPQTMAVILEMDETQVKEIIIYTACLAWAKHQLLIQHLTENPTDLQIREILGDLLYKIRFPTMEMTEFAEISEGNNILTEGEKTSIYYFFATKKRGSQLKFSTEERLPDELWIERTLTCVSGPWGSKGQFIDAIDFTSDRDIQLTGIGLYPGYHKKGYDVDIGVMQSMTSLFKKRVSVPYATNSTPIKIAFDKAIFIKKEVIYSVKTLSHDNIRYHGNPCKTICTKGNVTITFKNSPHSTTCNETYGQIPRLYFTRPG